MYPQPLASQSVANAQEFFRLTTQIESAGDIYEIDVSAKAIAIGPDSDIALLNVSYYDQLAPVSPGTLTSAQVSTAVVSPDRSFVARLDARLDQPYPGTGKKGRILLSLADFYTAGYKPVLVPFDNGRLEIFRPVLDVMAYYEGVPSLIPQRSDKRYYWEYMAAPSQVGRKSFVVVPFYGRKYASFDFNNWKNQIINVGIVGVNYTADSNGYPSEKILLASTAVPASGGTVTKVIRAAADGMWDALCISYEPLVSTPVGPIPTHIILSDDAL